MAKHNPKIDGPMVHSVAIVREPGIGSIARAHGGDTGLQIASFPAWLNDGKITSVRKISALCKWQVTSELTYTIQITETQRKLLRYAAAICSNHVTGDFDFAELGELTDAFGECIDGSPKAIREEYQALDDMFGDCLPGDCVNGFAL